MKSFSASEVADSAKAGGGALFELTPHSDGDWTEKNIHNFGVYRYDGVEPSSGLTVDSAGTLYGTTSEGGVYGGGTVYSLSPTTGGGWLYSRLYSFDESVQHYPDGGITFGTPRTLYGVYTNSFPPASGGVYEITF